jgi:pyruvate,water dikinase
MFISWFHEAEPDRGRFGGKGSSLIALHRAGFAVPRGFCISAHAYRELADAADVASVVASAEGGSALRDPAKAGRLSQQVLARLGGTPLPDGLEAELKGAYRTLTHANPGRHVAVRSSAVAEDGRSASFAGMYESFLNLETFDSVREATDSCYSSLWQARAIQYRAARGVDHNDESMAVVVMEMVPAVVAGVAFSVNPITGADDEVVINASWGLGESVVSGRVSPDHITARKHDGVVTSYVAGNKQLQIVATTAGGVAHETVPVTRAQTPCLSRDDVRKIVAMTRRVEEFYGTPQDIEFARAEGGWQLLQSRPITTVQAPERTPAVNGVRAAGAVAAVTTGSKE